jgi:hypothetical protein
MGDKKHNLDKRTARRQKTAETKATNKTLNDATMGIRQQETKPDKVMNKTI